MKKTAAILFTLLTAMSLAACSGNSEPAGTAAPAAETTAGDAGAQEETTESSSVSNTEAGAPVNGDVQNGGTEDEEEHNTEEINILVAYFSATNTTEGVAEHIANGLGADLYEIVPEEPYTDADLNYNDDNSRSTIEMNDPLSRPAISGSVDNMEQYDIVFIGYPIWWGEAPRIVSTFMESYDFTGKTLVPFCTSGGSGMGSSASNLAELADGVQWLSGQRLNGGSSQDDVMEWVNGLELSVSKE